VVGWTIGVVAGIGPALLHEGFVIDASQVALHFVYGVAAAGGAVAGALAVPDSRLRVFGALSGIGATAGATFAISYVAHGMDSISIRGALLIGLVGAAPGLMVGRLFYGMADDWITRR
ncbi:MAG: hypothetical protein ACYC8T_25955, partial [Myxococcaceae bacterium]